MKFTSVSTKSSVHRHIESVKTSRTIVFVTVEGKQDVKISTTISLVEVFYITEVDRVSHTDTRQVIMFLLEGNTPFPTRPNECRVIFYKSEGFEFQGVETVFS